MPVRSQTHRHTLLQEYLHTQAHTSLRISWTGFDRYFESSPEVHPGGSLAALLQTRGRCVRDGRAMRSVGNGSHLVRSWEKDAERSDGGTARAGRGPPCGALSAEGRRLAGR